MGILIRRYYAARESGGGRGYYSCEVALDTSVCGITAAYVALMHQVHGKVLRVSLNVFPMWLLLTYTRPRERYGRICQYKKVDPIFSNYLFCFSEFGDVSRVKFAAPM